MKSESDALRSSPGGSACPRPQGKATEGRMSASVAPRNVLARLRRGVAKPQVKPLIGVSDPYRRATLPIPHAAVPRSASVPAGSTVSTLSNVVAVHHIAKTTRTSSTSPHATSPYAASRTPRGNSFIRLVVGEQPDEADDEPKDRHDHKRRDDYPADPTGWAARCPEPRPRVGVGRPTRCLL